MIYVRRVVGKSMEPRLAGGDIIIARRVFNKQLLSSGDIVIALVNGRETIKRISVIDGRDIFILGDNSKSSTDSRTYGPITIDRIYAKYLCKLPAWFKA